MRARKNAARLIALLLAYNHSTTNGEPVRRTERSQH